MKGSLSSFDVYRWFFLAISLLMIDNPVKTSGPRFGVDVPGSRFDHESNL
jgi:hypothetical protein